MSATVCASFFDVQVTFDQRDLEDMGIPRAAILKADSYGELGPKVQGSLKVGWTHAAVHDWITTWAGDKIAERMNKHPQQPLSPRLN